MQWMLDRRSCLEALLPVARPHVMSFALPRVLGLLALLLLLAQTGVAHAAGIVTAAAVSEVDSGMRFEMQVTSAVQARVYVLDDPYRVVIDMPTMEFRVPQGTGLQPVGFVKEFRYGLVGQDRARIIFDVDGPTLAGTPRVTAGADSKTWLFSLDLSPTDDETFKAGRAKKAKPKKLVAADPVGIVPKPKAADPRQNKPLIVIDPGHGGPDSGAVSPTGQLEKSIVLAIGKAVRAKLNESGKYKVLMTRDTDVFIPLKGRVDFAQKHDADIFVSIHADSTERGRRWQRVSGGTIYARAERATDEQSRLLALKENAADLMAGEEHEASESDTLSTFGADWSRQETAALAPQLADSLECSLKQSVPMTPDSQRKAAFYVLRSPQVPSVLIETGYMNNKRDATNLSSAKWQLQIAAAISQAVDKFFERKEAGLAAILGELPPPC